jgi:hypothetical protein
MTRTLTSPRLLPSERGDYYLLREDHIFRLSSL